jgi:hypothetical protein
MWHRVAALIGRTVAEAQQCMSSAEFVDWCAFYQLEPWGYHADAWRMSVVAATVANYSGRVKKAVKPSDFLPKPRKKLTPAEMRKMLKKTEKDRG